MLDDIDKLLGDDEPTGGGGAGPDAPLVVVIDDDAAVRRSLRFALDKKFRVDVYSSGPAAVDMMTEETSVVILDIKMPDRDGFWTYKEIRKRDPDMPIIFNSAFQDLEDPFVIINEYRPFGYMTKSGDLAELLDLVEKAVAFRDRVHSKRSLVDQLRKVKGEMELLRKGSS